MSVFDQRKINEELTRELPITLLNWSFINCHDGAPFTSLVFDRLPNTLQKVMLLKKVRFVTQKWVHPVKEPLAICQCIIREGNSYMSSGTESVPAGPLMSNTSFKDEFVFIFLFKFAIRDSLCLLVPTICQRCVGDKLERWIRVVGAYLDKSG
jgi:hypothetical protein